MELFFILLVLLVTTRAFGEIAERLDQPALVGELIAGIALGAIAANYLESYPEFTHLNESPVFQTITDLGMFFIMLYAGLELRPSHLVRYSKSAFSVAVAGMVIPFALGVGLGYVFLPESHHFFAQCIFLGTALAVTAVPASVRILMDLNQLDSRSGQVIVSAAVFDDVLSLILLTWLTALISIDPANHFSLTDLLLNIFGFFAITTFIGLIIFPLGGKFMRNFKEKEFEMSALLIGALFFAVLAEFFDLHFIVGAFMAGLFFGRKTIDEKAYFEVKNATSAMTYGFLAPIFFASIGLNLDLSAVSAIPLFLAVLIVLAFVGKFLGAGIAAKIAGLNNKESAAVGAGMSARGAVELVIADIALTAGLFDNGADSLVVDNVFSAIVLMAVITTLVTPILLKRIYGSSI
ncbi:cation:proton antiporter [Aliikangiella marina]|uniref:Cation:proton antiporter n=1 Tax=Aliikangiella marina TaxID=1712262 RepID=A0A545TIV6_9GAMM|nr:cation:proton antiporter [Aliikangiella marina]TQV77155.1 cation:proton antiporter [Aliikangiella marina]